MAVGRHRQTIRETVRDRTRGGHQFWLFAKWIGDDADVPGLVDFAEQWDARDGWYFLTGEKANVDAALYKLGQYVENKESHANIFIVGNEVTGLWKKVRWLSTPEEIYPLIEEVLRDKI